MLTLVAAVLAYDLARDNWDLVSSTVDAEDIPRAVCDRPLVLSLKDKSWTRLEKDMTVVVERNWKTVVGWQVCGEVAER